MSITRKPLVSASENALDVLAARNARAADVIAATCRRRDDREINAKLVLVILSRTCPVKAQPRLPWYVRGAAARTGAEAIRRAWPEGLNGEEPPSLRTVRRHLAALQEALVIVRAPGDWVPMSRDFEHPERRPRFSDTYHVVKDQADADWWAGPGRRLLAEHPETRWNPTAWWRVFGNWRAKAEMAARRLVWQLFRAGHNPEPAVFAARVPVSPAELRPPRPRARGRPAPNHADAAALVAAARADTGPLVLLERLRAHGAGVRGLAVQALLLSNPPRLQGAVRLVARAIGRGDEVRNRAGLLVHLFKHAPELRRVRPRGAT